LKPQVAFKLWVNSVQRAPPRLRLQVLHVERALDLRLRERVRQRLDRDVAAHVALSSKGLKPGYHISGSRVETKPGAFKLRVNWIQQLYSLTFSFIQSFLTRSMSFCKRVRSRSSDLL
jgi:hypothetical protein